jgi:hypothetical protein
MHYPEQTAELLFTGEHGIELIGDLLELDPEFLTASIAEPKVEQPVLPLLQLNLFLGRRFATQNALTNGRSDLGIEILSFGQDAVYQITSRYNFWQLSGTFRYNLATDDFQPYLKLGYAWTWYRLEDIALDGRPIENSTSQWYNQPSFKSLGDLLPNSWQYGLGVEYVFLRSYAPLPKGIDLGLMLEYYWSRYELGTDLLTAILAADSVTGSISSHKVTTGSLAFGLTVSF